MKDKNPTKKILVVDDDNRILTLLERYFAYNGYQVLRASSGAEGLKLQEEADLLICDLVMQDMHGEELIARIRKVESTGHKKSKPVIICSGYTDLLNNERLQELHVSAVIRKPMDLEEVGRLVKAVME